MTLRKLYITTLLCMIPFPVFAQSASFINTPADARSAAMGNTGYASSRTAFATGSNSAAILFSGNTLGLGLSYADWMPKSVESKNIHFGGYYNLSDRFGLALGFRNASFGKMDFTDGDGNVVDSGKPNEFAIDLGAAFRLTANLALGVNARLINSDMVTGKDTAFGFDLHALYNLGNLNIGLGISNIGTKLDYGAGSKHSIPARVKAGAAYTMPLAARHDLSGNLDFAYQITPSDNSGIDAGLGVEYTYNRMISVRAGYHLGDTKKTGPRYATLGCGVHIFNTSLDFAYLLAGSDSPIKNTILFTLGWRM